MGYAMREKLIKSSRRHRSSKPVTRQSDSVENSSTSKPGIGSNEDFGQNSVIDFDPDTYRNWCYATEEQLEEKLSNDLEILYHEAISNLVGLGYDEDTALKAVLKNGHCYGSMNPLSNIVNNSLAYLNGRCGCGNVKESHDSHHGFSDLRQLVEYCLAGMVCLLQQVRPELSKGDLMFCLLMTNLHVGRASIFQKTVTRQEFNNAKAAKGNLGGVNPDLCRFHGGWGFGVDNVNCPKKFNTKSSTEPPSNQAKLKQDQSDSQAYPSASSTSNSEVKQSDEGVNSKDQIETRKTYDFSVLENFDSTSKEEKIEMVRTLCREIKELEQHAKDRKEWSQEKALQAARKLSHDLSELRILRTGREETQRLRKGKFTLPETTMKRLSEMENALRKASGDVDRANATARYLHTENAEISAEMEAYKLSASESRLVCLEAAKREKKGRKKLAGLEKQSNKIREQIVEERRMISEARRELHQINQTNKELEVQCKEESLSKEHAARQVEMLQRTKEAVEVDAKRRHEALRLKMEIDTQRCKDDSQRLKQEKASLISTESRYFPNVPGEREEAREYGMAQLLREVERLQVSYNGDRECFLCGKDEVSVIFLPCAHQVLCFSCSHEYRENSACPCCHATIQQKIRVFGATS